MMALIIKITAGKAVEKQSNVANVFCIIAKKFALNAVQLKKTAMCVGIA